jgi:hypothetical protein
MGPEGRTIQASSEEGAMMRLEFSNDETTLLREVLESRLGQLTLEIAHTDSHEYRDHLRGLARMLEEILERVAATVGAY